MTQQTMDSTKMEMGKDIPEGFTPTQFRVPVPFTDLIGPTWTRLLTDGADVGAWVTESVRNGGQMAHGAFLMALADSATARAANTTLAPDQYVLHVNLSMDFFAPAPVGTWVEARARVERKGSSMLFCGCGFYVGEEKIANATAVMKIITLRT